MWSEFNPSLQQPTSRDIVQKVVLTILVGGEEMPVVKVRKCMELTVGKVLVDRFFFNRHN